MVQNHMLQVLCLVAMEPPWSLEPDVVRDAKVGVLHCLRPMTPDDVEQVRRPRPVHRGRRRTASACPATARRCATSSPVDNQPMPPTSVNSTTETFVALRLFIDNWRWAGVPFYLRTGKRLPKRASEVAIQFKDVPQVLFNAHPDVPLEPTVLSLRVQPEEGLSMRIASKLPGPKVRIYPVKMEFNYSSSFGGTTPEAYERLLLDVMAGDATLFMRRDAVEAAWQFVMPILEHWEHERVRDSCRSTSAAPGARSRPTAHRGRRPAAGGRYERAATTRSGAGLARCRSRDVERELSRQMKAAAGRRRGAGAARRACRTW